MNSLDPKALFLMSVIIGMVHSSAFGEQPIFREQSVCAGADTAHMLDDSSLGAISVASAEQRTCGDQGKDNRPNGCSVLKDKTWVYETSSCRQLRPNVFQYTHCSGSTLEMSGTDLKCAIGSCGGGYIVRDASRQ